jgi:hypothetical protein
MSDWRENKKSIRPDVVKQLEYAGAKETQLSDATCAALACLTYKSELTYLKTGLPTGWKYLGLANVGNGYDAAALMHSKSKALVIVNRGTELSRSVDDIIQNVAAIVLRKDYGQIDAALTYLVQAWAQYNAVELWTIGHSLGAGLAEAQAVLGMSAITKAGGTPPTTIRCFGVGSAGYASAVKAYAAGKGLDLNASRQISITHLVREEDATESIGLNVRLGSETYIPSIYQPALRRETGRRTGTTWAPVGDAVHNHEPFFYFRDRNLLFGDHLMWRWLKSNDYVLRSGEEPAPYTTGQVPEEDC